MREEAGSGFSLVELILTVALITMLAAVVFFPAVQFFTAYDLISDARRIRSDLRWAQSRAIATGQIHTLAFSPSAETYQVRYGTAPGETVLADRTLTSGIDLMSTSFATNLVTFDNLGSPSEAGTVVMTRSGSTKTVSVNAATGWVTIQ